MKAQVFRCLQRVKLIENVSAFIPRYTRGRVVRQDFARSTAGSDTYVVWSRSCGSQKRMRTWVPSVHLEATQ